MLCTDVSSGIESLLHRLHQQQQQQQPLTFLPSPYPSTPQQPAFFTPAVGRGSFTRSSASSTEGSVMVSSGNASRVPPSILKQPPVPQHCSVTSVHTAGPVVAPAALGSASTGSTSINAKSLHLPPGADLNDVISEMFKAQSVAAGPPNATPTRKSSLVSPRSGPSPSADVTRSTSLRQPTKSEWPPLRHGFISTQLNAGAMPSPVDAVFQHMSFASPMTVTSNPVHSASGAAAPPSSAQMTPPAYHPPPAYSSATNVDQPTFSNPPHSQPPQRANHFGTPPMGRPQHDSVWPSPLPSYGVSADRRPYFDCLVPESLPNSGMQMESAANSTYRLVSIPLPDTAESESAQLHPGNPEESQTVSIAAVPKLVGPPSYQLAKSLKMNAVSLTPPSARRYFDDIEGQTQQPRFPAQFNCSPTPSTAASVSLTNGDANRTFVATPLLLTNGRHEPVSNGPVSYLNTQTMPVGMALTHAATAPVNQHVSN